MNDLVIGAWRNGITRQLAGDVATVEERLRQGFRLLPYESTVSDLTHLLDGYDAFAHALLYEDPAPEYVDPDGMIALSLKKDQTEEEQATLLEAGFVPNNYQQERSKKRSMKSD